MRLTRIYQQQLLNTGKMIHLSKEASHHLMRVLRLAVGAEFILFNGKGGEFKATIIAVQKKIVSAQVGELSAIDRESPLQIVLGQSVIRSEKMDYTLQKAVELGVTHIVPLLTDYSHSSLKLSSERLEKRFQHWQAVIIAACEQSGRTQIPSIEKPLSFEKTIGKIKADIRILLTPGPKKNCVPLAKARRILVCVGPEGGWSEKEIKLAKESAYRLLPLGPRILRTETAGLVAITLFQALLGDISLNLV